jgi:putative MATE family efflux protein
LGEKRKDDARLVALNGFFLAFVGGVVFAILGVLGAHHYFASFSTDPTLIAMGTAYTVICTMFSGVQLMSIMGGRVAQSTGNALHSMMAQMAGAVTNILLDPILIFGLFGFPRMEVTGAAVATVIGQGVSLLIIVYLNLFKNRELKLTLRGFSPQREIIVDIYRVGLPAIVLQSISSVMIFGLNKILAGFTPTAVTVLGVYFKLQGFIFMPVFGLCAGMVPIVAYNYGARSPQRILQAISLTVRMAAGVMSVGLLLFWLLPGWFLGTLFDAPPEMLQIGIPALRIISLHFIPAAIAIVMSSAFQALGNGMYSLVMSFTRQIIVILPVAWLMARFVGLHAVWWSFPIAEAVSIAMALTLFRRIYKARIQCMTSSEERCETQ